jgi:acetyl esterase/lipase
MGAFSLWSLLILSTSCAVLPMAKVHRNVIYGHAAEVELKMDLYLPTNATSKVLPVVMYVHGGGWRMGSKSMLAGMPGPAELLQRGYLVAAINYRLAPKYKFPAMLEDAKCAVRFLRAHAQEYNLDPDRIGVIGDSAGGHLVALLGLTDASAGFDGQGGWSGQSSRVQAVVDFYGPTDFTTESATNSKIGIALIQDAFGAKAAGDPILKRASPVTYVSSHAPPFLILHGDHDGLVELKQSVELDEKLKAAGVSSTFVVITNFAHGFTPWGLKSSPNEAELSKMVADFFDRNLQ